MSKPLSGEAEQFGRAVMVLEARQGLTPTQVATAAHISYPYLMQIRDGSRRPSLRKALDIAKVFGITLSDLYAIAEALPQLHPDSSRNP